MKHETTRAKAIGEAEHDARLFGVGFVIIRPDGAERIDPARVIIKPEKKPDAE